MMQRLLQLIAVGMHTFFSNCIQAQQSDSTIAQPLAWGIRAHYGVILPHSEEIRSISFSRPRGVEMEVSRQLLRRQYWQYCSCYPRIGISAGYFSFDNPSILGSAWSATAFVEPFMAAPARLSVSYRLGAGFSYLNRVFHPVHNPLNLFYSTPISFNLLMNLSINYRLTSHITLRAHGNFNHISNGGLKQPNKGINFPTLGLAVDYVPQKFTFPVFQKSDWREEYPIRWQYRAAFYTTAKTAERNDAERYWILGATTDLSRRVGRISALGLGMEVTVDYSLREWLRRYEPERSHEFTRAGILLGHELLVGRFGFAQQLGIYIYAPYKAMHPVYQRYELTYKAPNGIFGGLNLKAHTRTADFMDIRVGYLFPPKLYKR
ncbi:MAG: acyloxyacyl hydrolase [Cytophagales bacterium]|nr:acyloxyacyl hydrolase [Bernardetiaceae bacterium]MDW8204326.1 acyloxyacyl hydrolase [Cytophagales bacterium]